MLAFDKRFCQAIGNGEGFTGGRRFVRLKPAGIRKRVEPSPRIPMRIAPKPDCRRESRYTSDRHSNHFREGDLPGMIDYFG